MHIQLCRLIFSSSNRIFHFRTFILMTLTRDSESKTMFKPITCTNEITSPSGSLSQASRSAEIIFGSKMIIWHICQFQLRQWNQSAQVSLSLMALMTQEAELGCNDCATSKEKRRKKVKIFLTPFAPATAYVLFSWSVFKQKLGNLFFWQ